jgi:hypothetical protein
MVKLNPPSKTPVPPELGARGPLTYFPIRHHSPACSWHIREWIRSHHPTAILIEGPTDMNPLIEWILHPETTTPIAAYATYKNPETNQTAASYYPFCDYSPELVALREGQAIQARLEFIDLNFVDHIQAETPADKPHPFKIYALQSETHFKHSQYLTALAKKTGCRDHDELWDHLFEANFLTTPTEEFIQQVTTYCAMSRQNTATALMEADGTIAREAHMAQAIRRVRSQISGPILVVTGGFHTVALPALVETEQPTPKPRKTKAETQTLLMRYSFEQLDALNGYASGMPAPEYYQRLWETLQTPQTHHPFLTLTNQLLVELRQQTHTQSNLPNLSTADAIAALEQARRLAAFRGHPAPLREDLLDGVRSCCVKGAMDGEGAWLLGWLRKTFTGDRIGILPADVGVPPIVEDFRRHCAQYRLKIDRSITQTLTLDLYRSSKHRHLSQFLHQLQFLEIPFASTTAGPDFVQGKHLDRIQELWRYCWVPQTESTLIELSIHGATLAEAAAQLLQQAIDNLEAEGNSRSTTIAVQHLTMACRMGLQQYIQPLLDAIAGHIAEDPSIESIVAGMNQLWLLWRSREPLEAKGIDSLPELITTAYQKACYLIPDMVNCDETTAPNLLESLCSLRELLVSNPSLDQELFFQALLQQHQTPSGNPLILGGSEGLLHSAGYRTIEELSDRLFTYLQSACARFLRGLLRTCREILWTAPQILEQFDRQLKTWPEDDYLSALPELRLAFADLTPRETDRVSGIVAGLYGKSNLGNLDYALTPEDLTLGLQLNQQLQKSLELDGLNRWLAMPQVGEIDP